MNSQSIILIHGIWMTGLELAPLAWQLRRRGYHTRIFHYHSLTQSLDQAMETLVQLVNEMPGDRVHLVAHSMGGLLCCRYLAKYRPGRLGRVVALGSPFKGSSVARKLYSSPMTRWMLGRNAGDLMEGIGDEALPLELGIIAGNNPLGVGRLLASIPLPHDGTVAVAETELASASGHLVVPHAHFGMLMDAGVARQVDHFLQHGRFVTDIK